MAPTNKITHNNICVFLDVAMLSFSDVCVCVCAQSQAKA